MSAAAVPVPRPVAWRVHPGDAARLAADGEHCEARRCRNPVAVTTWRYYRWQGQVLLAEHLVCGKHGQEFAARYRIEIGLAPDVSSGGQPRQERARRRTRGAQAGEAVPS